MKNLVELMQLYHQFHQKKATLYTHFAGIPLVIFSIMIVLSWIHISVPNHFDITVMWLAVFILSVYYIILDWLLGLAMLAFFIILGILVHIITGSAPSVVGLNIFLFTFILGWVLQFIGHMMEGRKPAFLKSAFQLFIGPLFLMAEVFFMFGLKQGLHAKVTDEPTTL